MAEIFVFLACIVMADNDCNEVDDFERTPNLPYDRYVDEVSCLSCPHDVLVDQRHAKGIYF